MFESATVKLTAWYLAILIMISLLFSFIIYSIASNEVGTRIDSLQSLRPLSELGSSSFKTMRSNLIHEAEANLLASLIITNLVIWVAGGVGSYYLARRSLKPIEEIHEAQSRFTSDASHELRTPLASMKTELEVTLRDQHATKKEMRELLTSNLEEVNKLTELSTMLLQLSRLEHEELTRSQIELWNVVRPVIERFDKTGQRILLEGTKTLKIYAHPASLEELLTILIDNAIKYSPKKSIVTLKLKATKNMIGFEIINTGRGIDKKDLPFIFDRFYRADTSRTSGTSKGYGLGLSLAKKIVELHNGELTVTSASNAETTFTVLLPKRSRRDFSNNA